VRPDESIRVLSILVSTPTVIVAMITEIIVSPKKDSNGKIMGAYSELQP
jgi:hypothetical protein